MKKTRDTNIVAVDEDRVDLWDNLLQRLDDLEAKAGEVCERSAALLDRLFGTAPAVAACADTEKPAGVLGDAHARIDYIQRHLCEAANILALLDPR